ncbi:E3 ubiquitin-protein ligase DTX3L [Pseudoliparis swirei]|uniref:E3 ubiquitin-protein ligase DTX3L n=1 Tax=Pseudoliparis swirei TaxID=2059687 RepID=UPI0024BEE58A|nr:E3 ubiquitin-protein ligase DTX3L [Pseudoliparis swirei]
MEFITDISVLVPEKYFKDPGRLQKLLLPYGWQKKAGVYAVRGTFEELETLSTSLTEEVDRERPAASPHVTPVAVSGVVMAFIHKKHAEELEKIQGSSFSIEELHEPGGTERVVLRPRDASSLPVHADLFRQRFVTFYQRTASDLQTASLPPGLDRTDLGARFPELLFEGGPGGGDPTATGSFVHLAKLKEFLSQSTSSSSTNPVGGAPANTPPVGPGEEEDPCPICMEPMTALDKETLRCRHSFCTGCLEKAFHYKPVCPTCGALYGALTGTQPDGGEMEVSVTASPLPGYEKYGTITIHYHIPNGIQKEEHPSPRQPYEGAYRIAYLPDCAEGRRTLELLRRAFHQKLIFTVGQSSTSGRSNTVTWNDIHHKTSTHGGPTRYGYPDHDYLSRVQEELKLKGIE